MSGWLRSAALNTDRGLRLQYLAADGLNVIRADEIYRQIIARGARFPEQHVHRLADRAPGASPEAPPAWRLLARGGDLESEGPA